MKSPLAKIKVPADKSNYTKGRYIDYYISKHPTQLAKISEVTIHHMAGVASAESCGYGFQNPSRDGSAHYGIGLDGAIANYVDEDDTAWANSNWEANCRAVTIEVSNSKYGDKYGWPVSNESLESLIKLVADIAKRNNLGKLVKGKNLTWHQMYGATQCPGSYLLGKIDFIISEANKLNTPIDTSKGMLSGVNITRTTDALVMYVSKKTTGTNKYGTEAIIDPYGIVTKIEIGKGNASLGKGKVLSGHGKADKWIRENVKEGYLLWSENGTIKISKKQHRSVDGKNGSRPAESLVVYDTPGTVAKTNPYGREVQIVNGVAVCDPVYGKGHMPVPKDGYVLSGHGAASDWIYKNIKKGTKVAFNDKYITIG